MIVTTEHSLFIFYRIGIVLTFKQIQLWYPSSDGGEKPCWIKTDAYYIQPIVILMTTCWELYYALWLVTLKLRVRFMGLESAHGMHRPAYIISGMKRKTHQHLLPAQILRSRFTWQVKRCGWSDIRVSHLTSAPSPSSIQTPFLVFFEVLILQGSWS